MIENVGTLFEIQKSNEVPLKCAATAIEYPPVLWDMLPWQPQYKNSNKVIFPDQVLDILASKPVYRLFYAGGGFIYVLYYLS